MELNDVAEWKIVAQMRSLVEVQDPDAKVDFTYNNVVHSLTGKPASSLIVPPSLKIKPHNDMLSSRSHPPSLSTGFLRARDLNLEKASDMFLKFLKWRRTAVPNGFISEAQIRNELSQRKLIMPGFSKKGNPVVISLPSRHYPSKRDMEEFKSLVVYYLDKLCASMPRGQEKLIAIADFQGWGYSNCDIRGYLAALEIVQSYYPERLGKVFLIHVPFLFMKAWKIIYPFIDNNTKHKFIFVEDKNLRATLLEDIDESQLPEIYGGKLNLASH